MLGYDSYIDSQIPYVGLIPSHWKVTQNKRVMHKEKRICSSYTGQDILSLTMNGVVIRNLDAGGKMPTTFDGYQFVYPGELLMCLFDIDVTPRCVGKVNNMGLTSPAYSSFVLHKNADLGYFYYYYLMLDHTKELLHLAKNLRHSLTEEQLGQIYVPLPPILEQRRIASYLDKKIERIDFLISEAKASIEEYKSWKASIIFEAVTKGLDPNVTMKDSGIEWIGEVPKSWHITKIRNFVSIRSGITLGKQYPAGTQLIPRLYLRVANVKAEYLDLNDVATIMVTKEEAEKYALSPGELLMTEGGDRDKLGRGTIWNGEIPECLHQNHVFAVRVNEKYMLTEYLSYLTASPVGRVYFDITAKKTTNLASTNSTTILQFTVPVPSLEEQRKIVEMLNQKCASINEVIDEKQKLIADLEAYKKSLIFEVVTGKRRVV